MAHAYYADELYHHGILGQKWGVRRFQNPDGSLTPEGRIRYRVDSNGNYVKRSRKERRILQKQYDSLKKAKAKQEAEEIKNREKKELELRKKISTMTDKELSDYISRKGNEKKAYELYNDIAKLNPKKVSKGQKFLNEFIDESVMPAAKNIGKQWLEKQMKEKLGLNEKEPETETQRLKRLSAEWTNRTNILKQQNNYKEELKKAMANSGKQYVEVKAQEFEGNGKGNEWFINADEEPSKKKE